MNRQYVSYKFIEINADMLTPISIFQRLTGEKKFLLESSLPHEKKGKFSFIGSDPYEEIIGHEHETTFISHLTNETKVVNENPLLFTEKHLPVLDPTIPVPFTGGAIGYIGYDTIDQFETIGSRNDDPLQMPDVHLMLYRNFFVYNHKEESVYCVVINPFDEPESVLDERLQSLQDILKQQPKETGHLEASDFQPELTKEAFEENVKKAKEYIHQGDIFQVVLSQRMQATFDGDPFSFYRKLRKVNPSPYMFYVDFVDYVVLGASPESLLQTKGREIITNPIAGTRPRGRNPEEDEALMKELLEDEKEIAEHRMLIDLGRNDLSKVSEIGSISIPTLMKIEKYEHVMHLVSEVSGTLAADQTSIDALISCLPAGTVSGAPKIRAMQIIQELEHKKRGTYAGGIGYIGFNRDLNMALAIRSLIIKENQAYLQAGAGIVYDSDPTKEYVETLHKARSLMEVNKIDFIN